MIVVTDTSVVLNLAWLRRENLLFEIFGEVLAPPEVRGEFDRLSRVDDRFRGLDFPAFIHIATPVEIADGLANNQRLDPGEIAAIALAVERSIPTILIDDLAGRIAASELGLRPAGLIAVLIEAKRRGLVDQVLPLLSQLRDGARFFLDTPLLRRVAALTAEILVE